VKNQFQYLPFKSNLYRYTLVVCLSEKPSDSSSWTEDPCWSTLKRCKPADVLGWVLSGDAAAAAALLQAPAVGSGGIDASLNHGGAAARGAGDDEDDATTDGGDAAMAQDDPAAGAVDQNLTELQRQQQQQQQLHPVVKTLVGGGAMLRPAPAAAVSAAAVAMVGAVQVVIQYTHSLEAPGWFQPSVLCCDFLAPKFAASNATTCTATPWRAPRRTRAALSWKKASWPPPLETRAAVPAAGAAGGEAAPSR
jgi:hypothetical protein